MPSFSVPPFASASSPIKTTKKLGAGFIVPLPLLPKRKLFVCELLTSNPQTNIHHIAQPSKRRTWAKSALTPALRLPTRLGASHMLTGTKGREGNQMTRERARPNRDPMSGRERGSGLSSACCSETKACRKTLAGVLNGSWQD